MNPISPSSPENPTGTERLETAENVPAPSILSIVGDHWPHLLLGVFLAMGILGVGADVSIQPAFLIWLPPVALVGWLAVYGLLIARSKKEKPEVYDETIAPVGTENPGEPAPATPVAVMAASVAAAPSKEAEAAAKPVATAPDASLSGFSGVAVLWGSETGTAQGLADITQARLTEAGLAARSLDISKVTLGGLQSCRQVLILTSTWGDGEPPSNAIALWESLQKEQADLSGLSFSVLALGDTAYPQFCQCGKDFDKFLEAHGAKRVYPRVDCDLDYEAPFDKWLSGVIPALQAQPAAV